MSREIGEENLMLFFILQVKLLLKELEEARGRVVQMTPQLDITPVAGHSSSAVISEHLVTFR